MRFVKQTKQRDILNNSEKQNKFHYFKFKFMAKYLSNLDPPKGATILRFNEDITPEHSFTRGSLPSFIEKGTLTWTTHLLVDNYVIIEDNKYACNVPRNFLDVLPEGKIEDKPEKIDDVFSSEDLKGRWVRPYGKSTEYYGMKVGDYDEIEKGTLESGFLKKFQSYNNLLESFELMPKGFTPPKEDNNYIPKVGDWVICIGETNKSKFHNLISGGWKKGKVQQIESIEYHINGKIIWLKDYTGVWFFPDHIRKCLPHEIPNNDENLLEEAKRRYPVGTRFYCARGFDKSIQKVRPSEYYALRWWNENKDEIDAVGMGFVYSKGKWAEIVSHPSEKIPESKESFSSVVIDYSASVSIGESDDLSIPRKNMINTSITKIQPIATELKRKSKKVLF